MKKILSQPIIVLATHLPTCQLIELLSDCDVVIAAPQHLPFQQEPFAFKANRYLKEDLKIYESIPSKFLSKPKHNFKKR